MKKIFTFVVWLVCMQTYAQDLMRITTTDGKHWDFSINNVEEMKFSISKQLDVVGEWLWVVDGTMERWLFNSDGSFSACSFYAPIFDNHFVKFKEHPGTYTINNNIITVKNSDGQTMLIEVTGYSDFHMESAAGDIFYKVQAPPFCLTTADEPITIGNEGDIVKYTDSYYTTIEDNKIKVLTDGTGYALVEDYETKAMKAYRIDIEYVMPPMVDWTQYYNASSNDIKATFGAYDFKNEANTWVFMRYNAAIQSVEFTFTEDFQEVKEIEVNFYDSNKRQPYYDSIISNYTFFSSNGGVQMYLNPMRPNETVCIITAEHVFRIKYNCAYSN